MLTHKFPYGSDDIALFLNVGLVRANFTMQREQRGWAIHSGFFENYFTENVRSFLFSMMPPGYAVCCETQYSTYLAEHAHNEIGKWRSDITIECTSKAENDPGRLLTAIELKRNFDLKNASSLVDELNRFRKVVVSISQENKILQQPPYFYLAACFFKAHLHESDIPEQKNTAAEILKSWLDGHPDIDLRYWTSEKEFVAKFAYSDRPDLTEDERQCCFSPGVIQMARGAGALHEHQLGRISI